MESPPIFLTAAPSAMARISATRLAHCSSFASTSPRKACRSASLRSRGTNARTCRNQRGAQTSAGWGQLALRRLLSAPDNAPGRPKHRPAAWAALASHTALGFGMVAHERLLLCCAALISRAAEHGQRLELRLQGRVRGALPYPSARVRLRARVRTRVRHGAAAFQTTQDAADASRARE